MRRLDVVALTIGMLAGPWTQAAVYEVGPGKPLGQPNEVPWESLNAGDTVLIYWRTNAYRSKWVLCREGTESAPIVVRGVAGPNGQRPVIDGNGASTRSVLNYWNQPRGVIKIGGANVPPDGTPKHIVLEGLEIRSARPPYSFTAANGASTAYPNNAASVYVEKGDHVTIRNCVLHDSGNGLFTAYLSRDVLVEGNYIHSNGNEESLYEHNSYTAATGIIFQHNRYGPLRPGCLGNNLKDRSAGLVIRYNWIEGGNRQLDLVDGEDDPSIYSNPRYRETHVYGNVLIEPAGEGNRQIVHYGGDSGNTPTYRKGTLFFHHNTIVSTRTDRTTLFRLSTNDEQCDCRNNVFYVTAAGNTLSLLDNTGRLTLTRNWFKPGWVQSFGGTDGTVMDDGSNLTGTAPGFLDETRQNYRLAPGSPCIDAGTELNPSVVPDHRPVRQYRKHQAGESRREDIKRDLGAFEFSPLNAWRIEHFGPDYESVADADENGDPDGDGVANLVEYALFGDPQVASPLGWPRPRVVGLNENHYLGLEFPRRDGPAEVAYVIEVSTNLLDWHEGSSWSDADVVQSNIYTTAIGSGVNTLVRLNSPLTGPGAFMRLKILNP